MKTKKNVLRDHLSLMYTDIHRIKILSTDSFLTLQKKFYTVMRKHGLKQGTWSDNGRTICNPEWVLCQQVFDQHVANAFLLRKFLSTPPKDLLAYGPEPKRKSLKK
jgi:hypothetical protein